MSEIAAIGVDAGSTTWKAVAIDGEGRILARHLEKTHPRVREQTEKAMKEFRESAGAAQGTPVGATGYGRKQVPADRVLTEITCHAHGAFQLMRRPGLLIDLGGQDSKIILIDGEGRVKDFSMNDKCAAGTGRFLEVMFDRLHLEWEEIEALTDKDDPAIPISSTCTVFAESEVISLMAREEPVAGVVKGLHLALSSRLSSMATRMIKGQKVFMSGGVALNCGMVRALSQALKTPVNVLPDPQYVGALGAAISVLPTQPA